jgi:hypothetical protein
VLSKKNSAWFGLIAIVSWAVMVSFKVSLHNCFLVITIMAALWTIVIWRELRGTPKS